MKKTYISPSVRCIYLTEQCVLAGSPGGVTDGDNLGGDTKDDGYDEDNQFVKSKVDWDDKW